MVWVSTVLILGFGAITLYLRDPRLHPDEADGHLLSASPALLGIGLLRGKAVAASGCSGRSFRDLTEEGWLQADPQLGPVLRWPWPSPTK